MFSVRYIPDVFDDTISIDAVIPLFFTSRTGRNICRHDQDVGLVAIDIDRGPSALLGPRINNCNGIHFIYIKYGTSFAQLLRAEHMAIEMNKFGCSAEALPYWEFLETYESGM